MNFDKPIDRIGTNSSKWDMMAPLFDVDPQKGISMRVADMDFEPPIEVTKALQNMTDHNVYGYYGDDIEYREAVAGWMKRRHNWHINPAHIFSTHGLVNAVAVCLQAFTQKGDGVVLFTPVYHAFARVIAASERTVIECELVNNDGRYEMDFAAYDAQMTGKETMVILCSPHNPGGRVWTKDELKQVADFAKRNDLILVSDEIHHDLTFGKTHTPTALVSPDVSERLVTLTAPSKTFNLAGLHTGHVTIEDEKLRTRFSTMMRSLGLSPNSFGIEMTKAAYTHGDSWIDALCIYLDENRKLLDEGIHSIPGLKSMELESTYLSWVDFSNTGMAKKDYLQRVQKVANIAANHGETFGKGGESYLRFNFATQRHILIEAIERLQSAFSDLQ